MKLSFVIPSYNCAAWLPCAVDSCQNQTHKDVQIVIVNDGSTDSTNDYLNWLKRQNDERIKIVHTPNIGRSAARNLGNSEASGDIICVLDADDLAAPRRAEITLDMFKKGAKFLYGSAEMFLATGMKVQDMPAVAFDFENAKKTLGNFIVHSSVAYTKELALKFPYRIGEIARLGIDDWAQQIEIAASGVKFDFVPNVLCAYRTLSTAITQSRNKDEVLAAKKAYLANILGVEA